MSYQRFKERKTEREARKKRIADGKEEAPMYVVNAFLDAVEEPLKDTHIPQGKGNFVYTSLFGT